MQSESIELFVPSDIPQIKPIDDIMRFKNHNNMKNLAKTLSISSLKSADCLSVGKISRRIFNKVFESINVLDSSRVSSELKNKRRSRPRNFSPLDLDDLDDVHGPINQMRNSKLFYAADASPRI